MKIKLTLHPPRTVLDGLVPRVRPHGRRHGSRPWSDPGRAGFLTPPSTGSGLGGPMPASIAVVLAGRCRPSPDPVSEGASCDRHAGRLVAGGGAFVGGEGLL